MQCPACGANSNNSDSCIECGHQEGSLPSDDSTGVKLSQSPTRKSSTLIEFPGVNRTTVPEWRKELSVRVREVQERRAREAARDAAEAERRRIEAAAHAPQLELLPQAEAPAMNPLVAAALKRIERAHQPSHSEVVRQRTQVATAVAYVPSLEIHEPLHDVVESVPEPTAQLNLAPEPEVIEPQPEQSRPLVVVPTRENAPVGKVQAPTPKRLIKDDPNDPALNYLDSIDRTLRVDDLSKKRASAFRRLLSSVLDLLTCALLASPIALALYWKGIDLTAARPMVFIIGCSVLMVFLYFTFCIGLTGRTWAMKLFSMRVIDVRTGLIPTGSQSAGRAFFYLISVGMAGLGILYALVSREGDAMHDRFTQTAVIKI